MPTCVKCHRPLSDPKSIERGMGEICFSHGYVESELAQREEFTDQFDDSVPFRTMFVMKRRGAADIDQSAVTNVPHLVVHHSPDGFEFGYGGSGPADLALNACQLYLNIIGYQGRKTKCYDGFCWKLAWMVHQDFKRRFIENLRHGGASYAFDEIDAWMKKQMTPDLMVQCAEMEEITE